MACAGGRNHKTQTLRRELLRLNNKQVRIFINNIGRIVTIVKIGKDYLLAIERQSGRLSIFPFANIEMIEQGNFDKVPVNPIEPLPSAPGEKPVNTASPPSYSGREPVNTPDPLSSDPRKKPVNTASPPSYSGKEPANTPEPLPSHPEKETVNTEPLPSYPGKEIDFCDQCEVSSKEWTLSPTQIYRLIFHDKLSKTTSKQPE